MNRITKIYLTVLKSMILIIFAIMFSITTLNVITRYFFNNPIAWAIELGRYSFAAVTYLGAILVMRDDGHIGMDMIVQQFSPKLSKFVILVGRILVALFLVVFIIESFRMVRQNTGVLSSAMQIPMAIPYSFMVIGSVGMLLEEILNIFFPNRVKDDEADVPMAESGV